MLLAFGTGASFLRNFWALPGPNTTGLLETLFIYIFSRLAQASVQALYNISSSPGPGCKMRLWFESPVVNNNDLVSHPQLKPIRVSSMNFKILNFLAVSDFPANSCIPGPSFGSIALLYELFWTKIYRRRTSWRESILFWQTLTLDLFSSGKKGERLA